MRSSSLYHDTKPIGTEVGLPDLERARKLERCETEGCGVLIPGHKKKCALCEENERATARSR